MGNLIYSNDIITPHQIVTAENAVGYPGTNVTDLWHMKRRFKSARTKKSNTDYVIKFDFHEKRTIESLFLNNVNFNKVRIRGHATDLANDWSAASFDSGEIDISIDERVDRYKIYIALSHITTSADFNYRWLAIQIPEDASHVESSSVSSSNLPCF